MCQYQLRLGYFIPSYSHLCVWLSTHLAVYVLKANKHSRYIVDESFVRSNAIRTQPRSGRHCCLHSTVRRDAMKHFKEIEWKSNWIKVMWKKIFQLKLIYLYDWSFKPPNEMREEKKTHQVGEKVCKRIKQKQKSCTNWKSSLSLLCRWCRGVCASWYKIKSQPIATHRGIHFVPLKRKKIIIISRYTSWEEIKSINQSERRKEERKKTMHQDTPSNANGSPLHCGLYAMNGWLYDHNR